ncbi:MAG: hypothetical protein WBO23_13285 [Burkholderiales bacterium]
MRSIYVSRLVRFTLAGAVAIAALAQAGSSFAQQKGRGTFDHLRTSFPLTGVHAITPCESCHIGGQMAGTPRQCDYCHRAGSRIATTVKPARHVQTNEACDVCHRSSATWTGARFSHVTVTPGSCFSCHNGGMASGKPGNHVATAMSCDSCHRTTAWTPAAGFSHASVMPGTCATCHGVSATGKPARHVVTTASCDACHRTTAWIPATFSHAGVLPGSCATCHGVSATGKPAGHVATTASCDTCHRTTAWIPATFNHAGVLPGTCGTCHVQGGSGLAKPANHIPYETQLLAGASLSCDACHKSTTSFTSQTMNHNNSSGNGAGWCKGCHLSGTNYLGTMQKRSLTHERSTGVTDCSQSGCHRPLGTQGSTYRSW